MNEALRIEKADLYMSRLIVSGHALPDWPALVAQWGFRMGSETAETASGWVGIDVVDIETLAASKVSIGSEDPVLLFYAGPADWLACRLQQLDPSSVLIDDLVDEWRNQADFMLRMSAARDADVLLVNVGDVIAGGAKTLELLETAFGLRCERKIAVVECKLNCIETAVATTFLIERPRILRLFDELEAFAHIQGRTTGDPARLGAWNMLRALRAESVRLTEEIAVIKAASNSTTAELLATSDKLRSALADVEARNLIIGRLKSQLESQALTCADERAQRMIATSKISQLILAQSDQSVENQRLKDHLEELLDRGALVFADLWSAQQDAANAIARARSADESAEELRLLYAGTRDSLERARNDLTSTLSNLERERGAAALVSARCSTLESERAENQSQMDRLVSERNDARVKVLLANTQIERLQDLVEQGRNREVAANEAFRLRLRMMQRNLAETFAVNLRDPVVGENWHAAECDGRWTGAETPSSLLIPALTPGVYRVELEVVGSMANMLEGTSLEVNGSRVPLQRKGRRHPYVLTGQIACPDEDGSDVWTLKIFTPQPVCPTPEGVEGDRRRLGLRVSTVRMTRAG